MIESGVVEFAEGDAVANHGFAFRVAVSCDVCGVEQLLVAKQAQRAPLLIGTDYALSEDNLMEPLSDGPRHVLATRVGVVLGHRIGAGVSNRST